MDVNECAFLALVAFRVLLCKLSVPCKCLVSQQRSTNRKSKEESMTNSLVTVFGGSGFLGRYLVRQLSERGFRVRIAVRDTQKSMFLKPAGNLGQITSIPASINDQDSVIRAIEGADWVVNLVGIFFERRHRTFQAMHVDGARKIAEVANNAGIKRLVQISALGANRHAHSLYSRSKAEGETAVKKAFPRATIIRPSIVFGPEDEFFNLFGSLAKISPILPYFRQVTSRNQSRGGPRFQPVYVRDVATAIVRILCNYGHEGKIYEIGGPRIYDMCEIMNIINRETGHNRLVLGFPMWLATIKAKFLQVLPKPLLTPDQVKLLEVDNVLTGNHPNLEDLGISPTAAEIILPTYLKRHKSLQQNKRLRLERVDET